MASRTEASRRGRRAPPETEIPTATWLTARRAWGVTLALYALVAVLVGVVGAVRHDAPLVATVVRAATDPHAALAGFLGARALALLALQRHRDGVVATGRLQVTNDAGQGALVTVASFSVIGLLAAGVAMPVLYTTTRFEFQVLAAAVAVLIVPVSYALLAYQLGELVAADRYVRRYRVQPAVWHYAWTLPAVVLAWTLLTGETLVVPAALSPSGDAVTLTAWTVGYAAVCAPTAVAYCYTLRRQVARVGRALLP